MKQRSITRVTWQVQLLLSKKFANFEFNYVHIFHVTAFFLKSKCLSKSQNGKQISLQTCDVAVRSENYSEQDLQPVASGYLSKPADFD